MPPYAWINLEGVFWIFGGGLLVSVGIILARASGVSSFTLRRRSEEELEAETHEFAGLVAEQNRPVPLLIWLVGIGIFIWAAVYIWFSGIFGL